MNDIMTAPPPGESPIALEDLPSSPPPTPEAVEKRILCPRPRRELAILAAFTVVPFLPLLVDHLINLWDRPHYQFFPVVLIAAFVLTRGRLAGFDGWQSGYSRIGLVGMAVSYLGLVAASVLTSPLIGYAVLLLMLASVTHCLGGWALVRRLAGVGVLLLTLLPPPSNRDQSLILGLQSFATRQAGRILDVVGVPHLLEGNTIVVPDRTLFVEEACSGIHSLTSVLVITLIYLVWRERPLLHSLFVLTLAVLWVLAANVVRIVSIAYAQAEYGRDLASGAPHQILGVLLFLGCAGLVVSSDCLGQLFWPAKKSTQPSRPPQMARGRRLSIASGWRAVAAVVAVACFGLTSFRIAANAFRYSLRTDVHLSVQDSLMPLQWKSFAREADTISHATRQTRYSFGEVSETWQYQSGRWKALVSLDYPFYAYHPLEVCYVGNGWQVKKISPATCDRGTYYVVDLAHPEHGTGRLYYATVTEEGRFRGEVDDPSLSVMQRPGALFDLPKPITPKYQVQVMLRGRGAPPEQLTLEAESLFFEAVDRVVDNLPAMKGATP